MLQLIERTDITKFARQSPRVRFECFITEYDILISADENGRLTDYKAYEVWSTPIKIDNTEKYGPVNICNCCYHVQLKKLNDNRYRFAIREEDDIKDGGIIIVPNDAVETIERAVYEFNTAHGFVKTILTV